MKRGLVGLVLGGALVAAGPAPRARAQIGGIDEWAAAVADSMAIRWEGPRVELPAPSPRPRLPIALRSTLRPLSIHAGPGVPPERVERALEALEMAHDLLGEAGWPAPLPDGGRGGTAGFDIYLTRGGARSADARADASVAWSYLDGASAFGTVSSSVGDRALAGCVTAAYVEATLLGQDPAEAPGWRRATGAWLAWMVTGAWGCDDDPATRQRQPWRTWVGEAEDDDGGGALLLAMLSARHDSGSGRFVRDLWQLARQRTWERRPLGLRASPDLWEVLDAMIEHSPDDMDDMIEDFAVNRWFVGDRDRERGSPMPALNGLTGDSRIDAMAQLSWERLPMHTPPAEPSIEPHGSAYIEVDVSSAPRGSALRLWLRGEYGVRWSFVAVRLDGRGREIGRMRAPPRQNPNSYLVLELLDGTEEVLIAVTNLSSRIPDADEPDENVRSFKVIVARRDEAEGDGAGDPGGGGDEGGEAAEAAGTPPPVPAAPARPTR